VCILPASFDVLYQFYKLSVMCMYNNGNYIVQRHGLLVVGKCNMAGSWAMFGADGQ